MSLPSELLPVGLLGTSATAAAESGYSIERSVRLNSADSAYLSRTPSTAGNRKTFSISFWSKFASIGSFTFISSSSGAVRIGTSTNNVLAYDITPVSGSRLIRTTTAVFRDHSAWYHILLSVDTTSATPENRFRAYVNGVEVLFDVVTLGSGYLPQNSTLPINDTSTHNIGRRVSDNDTYLNGYLADVHFIDGQALDPTSFGEFDADTGIWNPIEYTGSYGPLVNQAEVWSNQLSGGGLKTVTAGFDANPYVGRTEGTGGFSFTPSTPIVFTDKVEVYDNHSVTKSRINSGTYVQHATNAWVTVASGGGTVTAMDFLRTDNPSYDAGFFAIRIDGELLVDSGITVTSNGFHLPFSDNSSAAALGDDTSGNGNDWTVNNIVAEQALLLPAVAFDGSGDYLSLASNTDFNCGTGDWTIEGYVYHSSVGPYYPVVISNRVGSFGAGAIALTAHNQTSSPNKFAFSVYDIDSGNPALSASTTHSTNVWYHIAVVRNGTTLTMYRDGESVASRTISSSVSFNFGNNGLCIGGGNWDGSNSYLNGFISNIRVIKGTALYTSNFTRPSTPLTNVTNTVLLCCQSSSSATAATVSPAAITANGNASATTKSDSTAANDILIDVPTNGTETDSGAGGEVRGNYCTWNPLVKAANVFTYENGNLEAYQTRAVDTWRGAFGSIAVSSGKWYWEVSSSLDPGSSALTDIYHQHGIALASFNPSNTPNSGGTSGAILYSSDNGNKVVDNSSSSYGSSFTTQTIGVALDLDAQTITFYRDNVSQGSISLAGTTLSGKSIIPVLFSAVNAVSGTARWILNAGQRPFAYDISTTISEATGAIPILSTSDDYGQTLSSGTTTDSNSANLVLALPMNGSNGGTTFTDYSATIKGSGTAKTVTANGNAQTSTAQSKWYGSSAYFDGSGDYLTSTSSDYAFGTGDCTVEGWAYVISHQNYRVLATTRPNQSSHADAWHVGVNGNAQILLYSNTTNLISATGAVPTGAWFHWAFTRASGTGRLFVNGVVVASGSVTNNYAKTALGIGDFSSSQTEPMYGYISDLRIYNGVAKYTANFTLPSSALYKALCTANLPAPTVEDGSNYMDVALYTGNGGTQTISGLGFSPDFVWIKSRSRTWYHNLFDVVRGATKGLSSNTTDAERTLSNDLTTFNSDGFSLSTGLDTNENNSTYVAWTWDAGSSTVSNTDGSITSQVRAQPIAGCSIVTYTGTGVAGTIGHGLGVSPKVVLIKQRSGTQDWYYFTTAIDGSYDFLYLNLTNAKGDSSVSAPSSSVFNVGTVPGQNGSGSTYVAYCFAPIEGYSSFNTYTGNGSTDGPFVFTGMRPRWVMCKRSDNTGNWVLVDTARKTYNVVDTNLYPNASNAEDNAFQIDALSNGFKIRSSGTDGNASGGTYIYAAFAENSFAQNARAR